MAPTIRLQYGTTWVSDQMTLTPIETSNTPLLYLTTLAPNKSYILLMYDPDAVNDIHNRIHWVVTDIAAQSANTQMSYQGPAPPLNSGTHRYVFELYEQIVPKTIGKQRVVSLADIRRQLAVHSPIGRLTFFSQNLLG